MSNSHLENHMDVRPPTMSGGQQQRVAIARAVISRPKILYADEPTGNVDNRIAARLMHLFEELNKLGTTVVIATHNESIVNEYGRPVLRIDAGRLQISQQTDSYDKKNEAKLNIQSNLAEQKEES